MNAGYYRFPTIHGDHHGKHIVFVSEDDLWSVTLPADFSSEDVASEDVASEDVAPVAVARRLTSNQGEVTHPRLSPTGEHVAFVGREEGGPEIYVMDAQGGQERRLTYLNSACQVVGWMPDARRIIFCSAYGQINRGEMGLFTLDMTQENGMATPLPYGPARALALGPNGEVVLGRNTGDPARWKRYRGGTAGHLWIDRHGDGEFDRFLADLPGNIASPMWLDVAGVARIFFVSDHEGIGNLYSCLPNGADIRRHTDHESYYVRNPSSDGRSIVYHLGADLYVFDVNTDRARRVPVNYRSPRVQRNRKFVDAGRYMDSYALHPSGLAVAMTSRGKAFGFYNYEGAVLQYGKRDGVRYRQPEWLHDGKRFVVVTDEPGEETLEIFGPEPYGESVRLDGLDLGRVVAVKASPTGARLALTNHRYELLLVDLDAQQVTLVDRSRFRNIAGFDWSPDGNWLAYSFGATSQTSELRLYRLHEADEAAADEAATDETDAGESDAGEPDAEHGPDVSESDGEPDPAPADGEPDMARIYTITQPVLHDVSPAFDPGGKYLYFLSYREFNPVYDALHFDLGFPWGMRPYLITLRADLSNPFVPQPDFEGVGGGRSDDGDADEDADDEADDEADDQDADEDAADEAENMEDEEDDVYEDDDLGEDDLDDEGVDGEGDIAWRQYRATARRETSPDAESTAPEDEPAAEGRSDASRRPKQRGPKPIRIDLEGIQQRVIAFPVPDARYGQIAGIRGKAIFTVFPITGQLDVEHEWDDEEPEEGQLRAYDFKDYRNELLAERVASFDISANGKKLIYNSGSQLRVINAGEKAPGGGPPRKSGWVPLHRVKVSVRPQAEWEQMFREAWRLQRDQFWTEDMSQVDWQVVFARYFDLIPRVSTRSELSDLLWEMQGELGTSHAYEFGGDYRPRPYYGQGFLGAEFAWDATARGYRVTRLLAGDPWLSDAHSALLVPGADIRPGDVLININGQMLDEEIGPGQMLVNQARQEVLLVFKRPAEDSEDDTSGDKAAAGEDDAGDDTTSDDITGDDTSGAAADVDTPDDDLAEAREAEQAAGAPVPDAHSGVTGRVRTERGRAYMTVVTRAMSSEGPVRYRQWVNENRRRVHEASAGRIGYVHIPDMGARGYAEFHRSYLAEVDRDGLIVDVRYNGGGHVSQLILEKLARRRIGYDLSRWGGLIPYPMESVAGPMVALTNEHAGSDGDIFSHSFKVMKLGPLIGKRTWGGVIGISPQHALVDGTVTTQPEYSFWFEDVGWNVENYGTDPDVEVDNRPQDYAAGVDAQLERAIAEAQQLLEANPVRRPSMEARPSRALPTLPPRTRAASQDTD